MTVSHLTLRTAPGLPEIAAGRLPGIGPVIIMRGESYYYEAAEGFAPEEFNRIHGVTASQAEAMWWGVVVGWHAPGANPANYVDGKFIARKKKPKGKRGGRRGRTDFD